MFNLKWCGISGGGAFFLSFVVALASGAGFPYLLVRPLIFGAVFFALAGGIWVLVNRFIPELLNMRPEEESGDLPGSRVDISVSDETPAPPPGAGALPPVDQEDSVDNISELLSGPARRSAPGADTAGNGAGGKAAGLDQNREDDYTGEGVASWDAGNGGARGANALSGSAPGGNAGGGASGNSGGAARSVPADILPDLDSMAGAFLPGEREYAGEPPDFSEGPSELPPASGDAPERRRTSGKGQGMAGDFNPKDLAQAMRTILAKE